MSQDIQAHQPDSDDTISMRHYPRWLKNLSLTQALGIIIAVSVLIVTLGYSLYWHSRDRKYDIARPGQNNKNQGLDVVDQTEDLSKPVDASAIEKKLIFLRSEQAALGGMNSLEVTNLSDQNLRLIPISQPSL